MTDPAGLDGEGRLQALDLEPIKARAAAATKGPWLPASTDERGGVIDRCEDNAWGVGLDGGSDHRTAQMLWREDAIFVAHARTDIPALIAEVERLRREPAAYQEYSWRAGYQAHVKGARDIETAWAAASLMPSDVVQPPQDYAMRAERDEWIARFNKLPEIVAHAEERGELHASRLSVPAAPPPGRIIPSPPPRYDEVFYEGTAMLNELAAAPPQQAPEKSLRWWVEKVLARFEQDEAQGYHTKDREYAISMLRKGLEAVAPPPQEQPQEKPRFRVGDRVFYVLPRSPKVGRPEVVRHLGTVRIVKGRYITVKIDTWDRVRTTSARFLEPADSVAPPPQEPDMSLTFSTSMLPKDFKVIGYSCTCGWSGTGEHLCQHPPSTITPIAPPQEQPQEKP